MRRIFFSALAPVLCLAISANAQTYKSDPHYRAAVAEGKNLALQQRYFFAIDAYRKANKIAGGKDTSSLDEIYTLQLRAADYKGAIKTSDEILALATNAQERSI